MSMSLLLSYKCIHLYHIIESTCILNHIYLSFSFWLTSASIIFSRTIMLLQMALFNSFYDWVVFYCVCTYSTSLSSVHLSMNKFLGCLCVLAVGIPAAMNIGAHVPFQIRVFPGAIPRNGVARWYSNSVFSFLSNLHGLHQLTFPPTVWEDSVFSTPSPAFVIFRLPWWLRR